MPRPPILGPTALPVPDVPKAELHVHLEGTASPALLRRLAARGGVAIPAGLLADADRFHWTGFRHFLRAYDLAAGLIRTAEDYRDVAYEYLVACAAAGTRYVELTASPDHARSVGLPESEHRAGIFQGIDDARARTGIEGRVLVTVVRDLGVPAAERVAAEAAALPHPYVVGFNMAGDEARFPAAAFARAFAIADDAGLGCSCHAGEHAGPASVRAALALPGVVRLSHGVRAIEDPALVAELAERQIVLEVCPTSNVALGVCGSYAEHPLPALMAAGVPVTLASDDPPYFGTSIGGEYAVARAHFGLDDAALRAITATACAAAFADRDTRDRLAGGLLDAPVRAAGEGRAASGRPPSTG